MTFPVRKARKGQIFNGTAPDGSQMELVADGNGKVQAETQEQEDMLKLHRVPEQGGKDDNKPADPAPAPDSADAAQPGAGGKGE